MLFFYGNENLYIDVTKYIYHYIDTSTKTLYIPTGDDCRGMLFSDPIPHVKKHIKIEFEDKSELKLGIYDSYNIKLEDTQIEYFKSICDYSVINDRKQTILNLLKLHNKLKFEGGTMMDEFQEQTMAMIYLHKDAKILEIGANKGRNTLILSSLINDSSQIVSLETDKESFDILEKNREANGFKFKAINAALSKRKLVQVGWSCYPVDEVKPEQKEVNTILYSDLKDKYNINIEFDTLICDCEGALYYILNDFPEIMNNIKLIIIENDFENIDHKNYCDDVFRKHGLENVYSEGGGYFGAVCYNFFYQVWCKK